MRPQLNSGTLDGQMENLEVRGYAWRHTVAFGIAYAIGSQLYHLIRHGRFEPMNLVLVGCLVLLWSLFRSSERYHLRIANGVFSGPPPRGLSRVQIPVASIDRARSARPQLFGGRTVWSVSGEAIYIDPVTVPKEGRIRVLRALGLA